MFLPLFYSCRFASPLFLNMWLLTCCWLVIIWSKTSVFKSCLNALASNCLETFLTSLVHCPGSMAYLTVQRHCSLFLPPTLQPQYHFSKITAEKHRLSCSPLHAAHTLSLIITLSIMYFNSLSTSYSPESQWTLLEGGIFLIQKLKAGV